MIEGGPFTDLVLDPTRTTRHADDPLEQRARGLVPGDELLVDASAYLSESEGPALLWCPYSYSAHGSAAVYPYKVAVHGRGPGQFKASEVLGWRRPVRVHRALLEAAEERAKMERREREPAPA